MNWHLVDPCDTSHYNYNSLMSYDLRFLQVESELTVLIVTEFGI